MASFSSYLCGTSTLNVYSESANLWTLVSFFLIALWLRLDLRMNGYPYDYGINIYAFWAIAFPYYLVETRGKLGMLGFLGFMLLVLFPSFVADLVRL